MDGSNFVTGGRNHPTMTMQALAFRSAETHREDGEERDPDGLRSVFRRAADKPADLRHPVIHFHIENPLPQLW